MKLNDMSIDDLQSLHLAIHAIQRAAQEVAKIDGMADDVRISLVPGQPVAIIGGFTMPEVDPADFPALPVGFAPAEVFPPVGHSDAADEPPVATGGDTGGGRREAPAASAKPASVPKEGPLGEDEKATIRQMHCEGYRAPMIAKRLARRVQTVSLYLARHVASPTTPKPVPPASSSSSKTGGTVQASIVPEASKERAPETGPMLAAAPDASSLSGAATIPRRQREIADAVLRLPPREGFDPELDLELVEGIYKGIKAEKLAIDLDLDATDLLKRFREITAAARGGREIMPIEDQTHLLAVLRARVAAQRGRAA